MMVRKDIIHLVSVSGGKDSTATLLLALKQFPKSTHAVFADTGNEHEATYEYLDYLEQALDLKIHRLKQDFTAWWWRRRDYVRDKWPEKGVPSDCVARAVAILEQGPTGNPYLDLCMLKGRFPSRMAQFCTQFLKTEPLTEFALGLVDLTDDDVWSWQGVRRDESARRANALGFENIGGGSLRVSAHSWLDGSGDRGLRALLRCAAQSAVRPGHVARRVHALHQCQQGRAGRNCPTFSPAHRPHCRVGIVGCAGLETARVVILPGTHEGQPGRAARQQHPFGGALGQDIQGRQVGQPRVGRTRASMRILLRALRVTCN